MFSFLRKTKANDSTQSGSHSTFLHRVKTSASTHTTDSNREHKERPKDRSKSFNISKIFLNELQESHIHEEALNSSDEDLSDLENKTNYGGAELNLSLSRFTSINQDKFVPQLLGLLHSKGLSNPFIIKENKDFRLSFSSNGEYIFLPSMLDNEEDTEHHRDSSQYEDEPVVFNFAVVLSLEKETNIDIKAAFLSSVADISWTKGIPSNRSIKNEMFELGHLDLSLKSTSMNYYVDPLGKTVTELNNEIVSKSYKFKKDSDIAAQPYFDTQSEFKLHNRHEFSPTLLKAGDYVFFNSVLISPSITESFDTLNSHISHFFKIFINDHSYRHELKIIRGPPLVAVSSNDKPLYINKNWNESLAYEVTMPKKFVTLGDELPLKMKFSPLEKGVVLKRVKVNIIETITYSSKDQKYEYEDREFPIHDKYITGPNETEESFKVAPLLEIKASPQRSSQALREVILKPHHHLLSSDNLLETCFETVPHTRDTVEITGPLKILSYLSFKNQENVSGTTKETKVVNDRQGNLDSKTRYNDFKHKLHPDSSNSKFVKVKHKFQISLRVSRMNFEEKKYHHYEVVIDTPIYLLNENCTSSNLVLPSYDSTLNNFLDDFEINLDSQQLPTFEEATSPLNSPALIPITTDDNILSRTSTIGTIALERCRSNIDDVLSTQGPASASRRGSRIAYTAESEVLTEESDPLPPPPDYNESIPLLSDGEESLVSTLSSYTMDSSVPMSKETSVRTGSSVPRALSQQHQSDASLVVHDHDSIDLTEQFHRAVYDGVDSN